MSLFRLHDYSRKIFALAAVTLVLPALAYAGHDNGKSYDGKKSGGGGNDHGNRNIPVVPEANAGWVLLPFFGAVLLFSSRQFLRAKASQN
jgi:hypothetical protein